MVARARLTQRIGGGGQYFAAPATDVEFFTTGCKVLDLALGGGWAEKRVCNVVGDKSTGKTHLAIEAMANFAIKYADGKIYYREAESAFDDQHAAMNGMPLDRVDRGGEQLNTVEDFFEDLHAIIAAHRNSNTPLLYILDSLDALSDREELKRDLDKGSYGANKAKTMSKLFRELIRDMANVNLTLMIISQVRANIGVTFGETTTRSGGRALDFYASQALYLSQIQQLHREYKINDSTIKRTVGIEVRGRVKKNKVGLPFREAQFMIRFGYGIDDVRASIDWLKKSGGLGAENAALSRLKEPAFLKAVTETDDAATLIQALNGFVSQRWYEIEKHFLPTRGKYAQLSN